MRSRLNQSVNLKIQPNENDIERQFLFTTMSPAGITSPAGTTLTSPTNAIDVVMNRPARINRIKTAVARASVKIKTENNSGMLSPNMYQRSRSDLKKNKNNTNTDLETVTNKDKISNSISIGN